MPFPAPKHPASSTNHALNFDHGATQDEHDDALQNHRTTVGAGNQGQPAVLQPRIHRGAAAASIGRPRERNGINALVAESQFSTRIGPKVSGGSEG